MKPISLSRFIRFLVSRYQRSLRWPIIFALSGVALIVWLSMGGTISYMMRKNSQTTWRDLQSKELKYAAEVVTNFMDDQVKQLQLIADIPHKTIQENPKIFENIFNRNTSWLELIYVDVDGLSPIDVFKENQILNHPFTISQSTWFLQAKSQHIYIGNVEISPQEKPFLIIAIPSADGGVVAALLDMNVLWKINNATDFGNSGQSLIIDHYGNIIAHPDAQQAINRNNLINNSNYSFLRNFNDLQWTHTYKNWQGFEVQGTGRRLTNYDWTIVSEVHLAEIYSTANRALILSFIIVILIWVLTTTATIHLMTVFIKRPSFVLENGIIRISNGDLNHRIQIKRRDEIGRVAEAFNQMASVLNEREQELKAARDQALESSRFKSELLAKVSHEFRTPLGVILGFSEILQSEVFGPLNEEQQKPLTEIINSSNHLSNLVSDLLDQSRLEAGKMKFKYSSFQISQLLEHITSQMELLAAKKKINLETVIENDVPKYIIGDSARIQQIIVNLVSNAIKFTDQGFVRLRIFIADSQFWGIEVQDSGTGIPQESLQIIFEPFKQIDGSITRQRRGTGLGLSIVKQLTEAMRGKISLISTPNIGSTFTVLLPIITSNISEN